MPAWGWALIAVGFAIVIGLVIWRAVRTRSLRNRFGPEYERTVDDAGSRRRAESDLQDRAKRRESLDIVPLSDESQARYADQWRIVQQRFVDRPADAVREADVLISEAMRERGYPMDDFDQRANDISVDHPEVVEHYRSAHATMDQSGTGTGASTENLREAMLHYRALFEELIESRITTSNSFDTPQRTVTIEDDDAPESGGPERRAG